MVAGIAGTVFIVIASVCGALAPQALFAVTEIVPPAAPTVAETEFVVDVPLQPPGNVHVYEVAVGTAVIL